MNNTSVDGGKDVTVNAADWSNLGTFEIAAAASKSDAVGVAAGFIENGNTIDRKITAEAIGNSKDRKTINADNFSVTAASQNGIVNTALGVGFMWALNGYRFGKCSVAVICRLKDEVRITCRYRYRIRVILVGNVADCDCVAVCVVNFRLHFVGTVEAEI